ncbi:hypothetical protein BDZ97DRAFT_1757507 [Flammula alnicola]|nr:hypothetical protein BDZ97DRAFT_1757507 [Flammula alnicola]
MSLLFRREDIFQVLAPASCGIGIQDLLPRIQGKIFRLSIALHKRTSALLNFFRRLFDGTLDELPPVQGHLHRHISGNCEVFGGSLNWTFSAFDRGTVKGFNALEPELDKCEQILQLMTTNQVYVIFSNHESLRVDKKKHSEHRNGAAVQGIDIWNYEKVPRPFEFRIETRFTLLRTRGGAKRERELEELSPMSWEIYSVRTSCGTVTYVRHSTKGQTVVSVIQNSGTVIRFSQSPHLPHELWSKAIERMGISQSEGLASRYLLPDKLAPLSFKLSTEKPSLAQQPSMQEKSRLNDSRREDPSLRQEAPHHKKGVRA